MTSLILMWGISHARGSPVLVCLLLPVPCTPCLPVTSRAQESRISAFSLLHMPLCSSFFFLPFTPAAHPLSPLTLCNTFPLISPPFPSPPPLPPHCVAVGCECVPCFFVVARLESQSTRERRGKGQNRGGGGWGGETEQRDAEGKEKRKRGIEDKAREGSKKKGRKEGRKRVVHPRVRPLL